MSEKKPTGKKQVFFLFILLLCFMFITGNAVTASTGSKILIIKSDGIHVEGELIAVKADSLLINESVLETAMTVPIKDIALVIIDKKPRVLAGLIGGALIGGVAGSLYATSTETYDSDLRPIAFIVYGGGGFLVGAVTGSVLAILAGKNETYNFQNRSESQIKIILRKIRKYARISNFN